MFPEVYKIAFKAHKNQIRKDFDLPYLVHPLDVVKTLMRWCIADKDLLNVGILHDVIEDTELTAQQLVGKISDRAIGVVNELTYNEDEGSKSEYMESFLLKSDRAIVGKLADRFCNVLDFMISKPDYAKKYLMKATPVFEAYKQRKGQINDLADTMAIDLDFNNLFARFDIPYRI